jgi:integrase/recombinase XerD
VLGAEKSRVFIMTPLQHLKLAPAIESYLGYCQKTRRLSRHTCSAYRTDLAAFRAVINAESADCSAITTALRMIIENPEHKAATIGRRVIAIRSFLSWCDKSLAHEVLSSIRFRMKRVRRLPRTIPRSELNLLFAGARDQACDVASPELHLILMILASTGLRIAELCSLRVLDVDAAKGELKVFGKGAKERVVMVANSEVRGALGKYIGEKRREVVPTAPLFPNRRGKAIAPKWVQTRLRRLAEVAGVQRRITPHMFRHTAATLLIEGGVDIRFVQRLLGHANLATTEIYTHVSDQALRSALERADVMRGFVGCSVA